MRLIDADKLIEEMCNGCDKEACDGLGRDSTAKCYSVRLVEEAQTAYDVDEVVEKLLSESLCAAEDEEPFIMLDEAIEIVKAGGVHE